MGREMEVISGSRFQSGVQLFGALIKRFRSGRGRMGVVGAGCHQPEYKSQQSLSAKALQE